MNLYQIICNLFCNFEDTAYLIEMTKWFLAVRSASIFVFREHFVLEESLENDGFGSCRYAWVWREELINQCYFTGQCTGLKDFLSTTYLIGKAVLGLFVVIWIIQICKWTIDYRLPVPKWGRPWTNGNKHLLYSESKF